MQPTKTMCAIVYLALAACSRTGTGIGGSGGDASDEPAAGGAGGAEPTCEPRDVFTASDGCYQPDALCCSDLYCLSLEVTCNTATDGLLPIPYLCTSFPPSGAMTDHRQCQSVSVALDCTWGTSKVLCCE